MEVAVMITGAAIMNIVGVVRDTKYENMRDEMPIEVFVPYNQLNFVNGMTAA